MPDSTPDSDNDRWVTIAEAGRIFDRSERTIRRWVARGEIEARQDRGRTFVRLNVTLDSDRRAPVKTPDIDRQTVLAAKDETIARLVSQVEAQQRIIEQLTQALEREQTLVMAAQQKLIEAGAPDRESSPARPARRRWWWPWG